MTEEYFDDGELDESEFDSQSEAEMEARREALERELDMEESKNFAPEAIAGLFPGGGDDLDAEAARRLIGELSEDGAISGADALRGAIKAYAGDRSHKNRQALISMLSTLALAQEGEAAWNPSNMGLMHNPPARQFVVEGILAANRLALFSGDGATGKSFCIVQLVMDYAMGRAHGWLECPDMKIICPQGGGKALYLPWEDEREEVSRRALLHPDIRNLDANGKYATIKRINQNLFIPEMSLFKETIWERGGGGANASANELGALSATGKRVQDFVLDKEISLVVFDTMWQAMNTSPVDPNEMTAFCREWDSFAERNAVTVILVMHPPKDGKSDFYGSASANAMKTRILLKRQPGDEDPQKPKVIMSLPKANYVNHDGELRYELKRDEKGWIRAERYIEEEEPPKSSGTVPTTQKSFMAAHNVKAVKHSNKSVTYVNKTP